MKRDFLGQLVHKYVCVRAQFRSQPWVLVLRTPFSLFFEEGSLTDLELTEEDRLTSPQA